MREGGTTIPPSPPYMNPMHISLRNLATLLAIACLASSCRTTASATPFQNPSREARQLGSSGPPLTYVVIGDSTAAGQGGSYEKGIALSTARALAGSHRVSMTNLAVSGARTKDVLRDQLTAAESLRPTAVLISLGANDVIHLTSLDAVRRDLTEIVRGLKKSNPSVAIVVTGSPDMGAPPRIPWLLRPVASWRTRAINRVFTDVAREEGLTFAPIALETGPLFRRDHTLFFTDNFHPNDRGYATWLPILDRALGSALRK
jgi:lysophospholipase L1-like esterase